MLPAIFVYDDDYASYRFHDDHPWNPTRLEATHSLARELGLLPNDRIVRPAMPDLDTLRLGHSEHYIELVRRLSESGQKTFGIERMGLGTADNPVFLGMHEAASLAVGGTLKACQAVLDNDARRALNIAGGLHHAGFGHASGFCIYNDLVVAIRWLRRATGWRVLYVDTDVHHGDGVQDAFYDDPDVFVLSSHESGRFLFPGTGAVDEIGTGEGYGATMNIPLQPTTDDSSWLEALTWVLPAVFERFQPDIVVSQHGCDGHYWDPLADLCATTRFYASVPALIKQYADIYTEGRWVATGGGGYQTLRVVPRVWTLLWAVMAGRDIAPDARIPKDWLNTWQDRSPAPLPPYVYDQPEDFPPIKDRDRVAAANRETIARIQTLFPDFRFGPEPDTME